MQWSRASIPPLLLLLACADAPPTGGGTADGGPSPGDASPADGASPDGASADADLGDAAGGDGAAATEDAGPAESSLGGVGSAPDDRYPPTAPATTADWWVHGDSGDDGNDGTRRDSALRTLDAALDRVADGERIIVEGTLRPTSRVRLDGAHDLGVEIFNYGTERWILDFTDLDDSRALDLAGSGYHVKGVEIRNVPAERAVDANGQHNTLEDFVIHHVNAGETGTGIQSFGGRFNVFVDGLIYHLGDGTSVSTNTGDCMALTGPAGDTSRYTRDTYVVRVMCSNGPDDGYDLFRAYDNYLIDSVAVGAGTYWNGAPASTGGDGFGFKMGGDEGSGRNHFIGCIAVNNRLDGWHHNTATEPCTIRASTAVGNGRWGFDVGSESSPEHVVEDCISHENAEGHYYGATSSMVNNAWDLGIEDPGFYDAPSGDFSLAEGSPARGVAGDGGPLGASRAALELLLRNWDVR